MWINLIFLLIIIFLLITLSMIWPPDSPWAPWWRTSDEKIREALNLAKVTKKDTVYDLGCGDGRVLTIAATEFGARGIGIEIDPLRAFIATLILRCNRVSNKVVIKRKNFFDEELSPATVIFLYLVPKTLQKLEPKLLKELRPGSRIITIKYEINLPETDGNKELGIRVYAR